jgi:hypothetical protein
MPHAVILTCCRGQYLASKCDQRERGAYQLRHILQGPIGVCSRTNTENKARKRMLKDTEKFKV